MSRHGRHRRAFGYTTALLAVAGLLAGGWQAASRGSDQVNLATNSAGMPVKACSKAPSGRVVNCERPVPAALLPATARDNSPMTTLPSNLAGLVDTRTWTSGGGNTYPGAQ